MAVTADPRGFEEMLTGGHPNSLGRTEEVVELVLADGSRLADLYDCYGSDDEVVRLRVSSAMKRICRVEPDWLLPYVDRLLDEVSRIEQASAQWTLAQLFGMLRDRMSSAQRCRATEVMKRNLAGNDDWIVQCQTIETLASWAGGDPALVEWLVPRLRARTGDRRKSVSKKAARALEQLT